MLHGKMKICEHIMFIFLQVLENFFLVYAEFKIFNELEILKNIYIWLQNILIYLIIWMPFSFKGDDK
jgi:hypothetical protein